MFLRQYGRTYTTDARGDLALMVCTDDPLADPHFLRRRDGRWEMDIVAEVQNTQNVVAGVVSWHYRGRDDDFRRAFADRIVIVHGWRRLSQGDNRRLPLRDPRRATPPP